MSANSKHNQFNDLEITDKVDIFNSEIWQIGTIIKKTRNKNNSNQMMLYNFTVQIDSDEKIKIKIRNFNRKRLKLLNTITPMHSYLNDNTKEICNSQRSSICNTCKTKFCIQCYNCHSPKYYHPALCYKCYAKKNLRDEFNLGDKVDAKLERYKKWHWHIATIQDSLESNGTLQLKVYFDGKSHWQWVQNYKPLHTYTARHAYLKYPNRPICISEKSNICKRCTKKYCVACFSSTKNNNECHQCFVEHIEKWLENLKVNDKVDIYCRLVHDSFSSKCRWYAATIITISRGIKMKILLQLDATKQNKWFTIVVNDIAKDPQKLITKLIQPLHTHTPIHRYASNECKLANAEKCSVCKKTLCMNCALVMQHKKYVCFQCLKQTECSEKYTALERMIKKTSKRIKIEKDVLNTIIKYSLGVVFMNCSSIKCSSHRMFEDRFQFLKHNHYNVGSNKNRLYPFFFCDTCNQQKQNEQKQWLQQLKIGDKLDINESKSRSKNQWEIATVKQIVRDRLDENNLKLQIRFDAGGRYYGSKCIYMRWIDFKYNDDAHKIINKLRPLHTQTAIHEYTTHQELRVCYSSKTQKCNFCMKIYCKQCIKMIRSKHGLECSQCVQNNEYNQKHKVVIIIIENELFGTNIQIEQNIYHIITKFAMGYVLIECGYMRCSNHMKHIERFADFMKFQAKINYFCDISCKENENARRRQKHMRNLKNEEEIIIQKEKERQRNERNRKEKKFLSKQEKKRNKKRLKKMKKKQKKKLKNQAK